MKFLNVPLSKTFAVIVIIIVVSVFLLPVLTLNFMVWLDKSEFELIDEQINNRKLAVTKSLGKLNFKDKNLMECVKEAAMERAQVPPFNSGGIDSVVELARLNCFSRHISNLDGLEDLLGLESVDLSYNSISNIESLAKLKKITFLNLSNNNISNINPLLHLNKIEELDLSKNKLSTMRPLLELDGLKELDMPDTSMIACYEIQEVLSAAKFIAHQNSFSQKCRGEFTSEVERLQIIKKSGGLLSLEEETVLLEYELSNKKNNYYNKYKESAN